MTEFELRVLLEPNYEGGEGLNYNSDYQNKIDDFCAVGILKASGKLGSGKRKRTGYTLTELGQGIVNDLVSKFDFPRLALVSKAKEFISFVSVKELK